MIRMAHVELPERTTPLPQHGRRRSGVGRLGLPRQRRGEQPGERVVRIYVGWRSGRTYAYRVRGPVRLGDYVEADTPFSGRVVEAVVGFGRGGYRGPLKRAKVIR